MKYLKKFNEALYQHKDDQNIDIINNAIDIVQDLLDEGINVDTSTIGYSKAQITGDSYMDNDIYFQIYSNDDDGWMFDYSEYKTLDYDLILPYLKSIFTYIESESRYLSIELFWLEIQYGTFGDSHIVKNTEYKIQSLKDIDNLPRNDYHDIIMKFKLK